MSWVKVFAYYAIAIALSLHLRGVHEERNPAAAAPEPSNAPFLEAVPERIDRVRLEDEADVVLFERREGRWVVAEPAGVSSPGDVVDAVLESLTGLPVIDVVADGVEHEGQFGLAPPKVRLRLESAGEVVANVVLGGLNPTRTAVYAKKAGKEEVVLLGLNPKYYVDLVFENVRRQQASAGVAAGAKATPTAPSGAGPVGEER